MLALSLFFIGFLFNAVNSFESDLDILSSQGEVRIKVLSVSEKNLINEWVSQNEIIVPKSDAYYKYILKKYPDKPWLQ